MPKKSASRVRKSPVRKSPIRKAKSRVRKSRVRKAKSPVRKSRVRKYKMQNPIPLPKDLLGVVAEFTSPVDIFRNREMWDPKLVDKAYVDFFESKIIVELDRQKFELNTDSEDEILMFYDALDREVPNFPIITDLTIIGTMTVRDDREKRMSILVGALQTKFSFLRYLKISHNTLRMQEIWPLLRYLQSNTTITTLDLSHNHLCDQSVNVVKHYLFRLNTTLLTLDLSHNDITAMGAEILQHLVLRNRLIQIIIHHNPRIPDEMLNVVNYARARNDEQPAFIL